MDITLRGHNVVIGNNKPLVFIGGPCVIEDEESALESAERIREITACLGMGFIYKSSYDKANRSSADSFRGVGIDEGLRILEKVRLMADVPVLSDVHTPDEAHVAAEVLDVLQIPAFLCRQTDLLIAAGRTGKVVNIKKGQFMAPWDMKYAVDKVEEGGTHDIMLTERGTTFGYNNLVVDMISLSEMALLDIPVVFDAGHSVQRPGGLRGSSGGRREAIPTLARAAAAVGISALFLETHSDPDNAPCDGQNMWPLDDLENFLRSILDIDVAVKKYSFTI